MKQIVQTIAAVLVGLLVAFIITVQFEKLGAYWFPLPNPAPSPAEYMEYVATSPALLHGISIIGYGLSAFLGAYVGGRLSPKGRWKRGSYITGFSYLLPIVVLLISFPRPIWAIVSILLIIVVFTQFSAILQRKLIQNG
jgi:hypothetical protein